MHVFPNLLADIYARSEAFPALLAKACAGSPEASFVAIKFEKWGRRI